MMQESIKISTETIYRLFCKAKRQWVWENTCIHQKNDKKPK